MINSFYKISLLMVLYCNYSVSQNFSALWQSHYSYNNITDIVKAEDNFYAASENAVFRYNVTNQNIETITTVEGLSGDQISTIFYSEAYQVLLIGYETGLIELYSEIDNSVLAIVDIINKVNITPANKGINHFYENEGLIYISTDFGISVYNLDRLEFGDTYFIGIGGTQIPVEQTTVLNNLIYVACSDNNGLKRASLDNPNLIDSNQWEIVIEGDFVTVNTFNDNVYTARPDGEVLELDGITVNTITNLNNTPLDSEINEDILIFTTSNRVYHFNETIQISNSFNTNTNFNTQFSSSILLNNVAYIGSADFGVLSTVNSNSEYEEIKPNGPLLNTVFKVNAESSIVWVTYGDYSESLNPSPARARGLSFYRNEQWESIPYNSLLSSRNLNSIAVNPFIENQVYISSFGDGILEINNFEPAIRYDQSNSGLEPIPLPNSTSIRVSASVFDSEGKLWSMSSRSANPLKSYDPITDNWIGYDFSSVIPDALADEFGFFDMVIDPNGTKWIGGYSNGLYAYNESISDSPLRNIRSETQNMLQPPRVTALEVDNNNQLWIGFFSGLRVLFNTNGFYNDPNPRVNPIIILEDGIAQELLTGQSIRDIEVDGSNNKWIGTANSGVFYLSPDGQNTIYHFTKDNSPLPSNSIFDISVSPQNGTVFFGTDKGMVSFNSGGSDTTESLESAFVYPNPVRPEYNILGFNSLNDISKGVKINGLTENVNIKITDIEGNLVAEAQSGVNLRSSNYNFAIDGGTAVWNGKNLANSVVRSGVYLILIYDLNSFETKVLKLLVIR